MRFSANDYKSVPEDMLLIEHIRLVSTRAEGDAEDPGFVVLLSNGQQAVFTFQDAEDLAAFVLGLIAVAWECYGPASGGLCNN